MDSTSEEKSKKVCEAESNLNTEDDTNLEAIKSTDISVFETGGVNGQSSIFGKVNDGSINETEENVVLSDNTNENSMSLSCNDGQTLDAEVIKINVTTDNKNDESDYNKNNDASVAVRKEEVHSEDSHENNELQELENENEIINANEIKTIAQDIQSDETKTSTNVEASGHRNVEKVADESGNELDTDSQPNKDDDQLVKTMQERKDVLHDIQSAENTRQDKTEYSYSRKESNDTTKEESLESNNLRKENDEPSDIRYKKTQSENKGELIQEESDYTSNNAKQVFNERIQDIISDIDVNIRAQEKITKLKEQELQLIQKQQELTNQINQQQMLAQKLIAQNQLKEQELRQQQRMEQEIYPYKTNAFEHCNSFNQKESTNISRTVDLRKIFTPATDAPEIVPKNRKLYASSAFYSPTLHPTVEDQVELARRISNSLSDISNQKSKGQSMYVNRKKRSVKWVHEGRAQGENDLITNNAFHKENSEASSLTEVPRNPDKIPLKLVMNPRGQLRDLISEKESINVETGLLSPDNCAELITALQLHMGRGAELFAKRRRKADNWVVDEINADIHMPSGIPDHHQYHPKPPSSANILPAYSDAGKHRVQLNIHQDQLIEKYSKPGLQVVKSPWEAALQTGSASAAFLEKSTNEIQTSSAEPPIYFNRDVADLPNDTHTTAITHLISPPPHLELHKKVYTAGATSQRPLTTGANPTRELAYKPSVAQGWKGPSVELPKGLYVPQEISLASYAPPPKQHLYQEQRAQCPGNGINFPLNYETLPIEDFGKSDKYPNSKASSQQPFSPSSNQIINQSTCFNSFNPSPLSYDKLSKFESTYKTDPGIKNQSHLTVGNTNQVRNVSPTPFGMNTGLPTNCGLSFSPSSNKIHTISGAFSTQSAASYDGHSFNNKARGWLKNAAGYINPSGHVYANSLPYSDF